jgi:hypothetical protein
MELDPLSHTTLKEIPLDFINAVSATRRNWEQRQKICRQVRKSTLDQCQPTPLERYMRRQPESLFSIFSKILFQMDVALNFSLKGRPMFVMGRWDDFHPKILPKTPNMGMCPT